MRDRGDAGDAALPVDPDVIGGATDRRIDPRVVVAIAVGALPGGAARYALTQLIVVPTGHFPWATFWTNLSGSLALGVLLALLIERYPPSLYARAFIGTGFLGAYTTFSTFAVETDLLVKDGHAGTAGAYVGASLAGGLAAAGLGLAAGRWIGDRRR